MNILLIGPQGSGKGTQARILMDKHNFFYFESGEFLRKIAQGNPEVKKMLDEGILVPDKEMTSYMSAYMDKNSMYDGIIFDGFPRTLEQYIFWKKWLKQKQVKLDLVIDLEISEKETIRRLSARRQDPATGKIYNLITDPPPGGVDTSELIQRDDDKPDAIKKRLSLFGEKTEPLIAQLKKETKVVEIDGEQPIEKIADEIEVLVNKSL